MTIEHIHNWRYTEKRVHDFDDTGPIAFNVWTFVCKCGKELGDSYGPIHEIERRLNATELLRADVARNCTHAFLEDPLYGLGKTQLLAYAAALED